MVIKSKVLAADVSAVEDDMNVARSHIERCKIDQQKAEAELVRLTQKRDLILRTARSKSASAGDGDKGEGLDPEEFLIYQTDSAGRRSTKKSLIVVEDDVDEVDIFECVGVAKCGRCGQRLPLDVESMEEHAQLCDIKESVRASELAAANAAKEAPVAPTGTTGKKKSLKVRLSLKNDNPKIPPTPEP